MINSYRVNLARRRCGASYLHDTSFEEALFEITIVCRETNVMFESKLIYIRRIPSEPGSGTLSFTHGSPSRRKLTNNNAS